jgi:hypothetical protein
MGLPNLYLLFRRDVIKYATNEKLITTSFRVKKSINHHDDVKVKLLRVIKNKNYSILINN